jgi:hypothetical protein
VFERNFSKEIVKFVGGKVYFSHNNQLIDDENVLEEKK